MPYLPQSTAERPSAAKRGYDRKWRTFRDGFLKRRAADGNINTECRDCRAAGRYTLAAEVHHVRPLADYPELRMVDSNLVPLCKTCHSARTARGE